MFVFILFQGINNINILIIILIQMVVSKNMELCVNPECAIWFHGNPECAIWFHGNPECAIWFHSNPSFAIWFQSQHRLQTNQRTRMTKRIHKRKVTYLLNKKYTNNQLSTLDDY